MASKELTYLSTEGPFNVYEKGKQKEPIDDLKEFQKEYGNEEYECIEDIENETTVLKLDNGGFIIQVF